MHPPAFSGIGTEYALKGCRCVRCCQLRAELNKKIAERASERRQRRSVVRQEIDIKLIMEGAPDCVNEVLNRTHSSEDARIAWVRDLERRVKALESKDTPHA